MRNGAAYLSGLNDGRCVIVDGEHVEDVTSHPGFAGVAASVAALYDLAADPDSGMQFTAPETGRPANRALLVPRSREDLALRRGAIEQWARATSGFVGRSPDHVGGFFAGFSSAPQLFDKPERAYGEHVTAFYRRLLDEDLFVSYVIIPPQTAGLSDDEFAQVAAVSDNADGIVVRGTQMLGTSTAVSDMLFVSCIKPLGPADAAHGLSFVLPLSAPGLRVLCRRPYASGATSSFDYPLSTRFDESDALIVFDDVFVPWEHVFVYRDPQLTRDQFFRTAAHALGNTQSQIRLTAKLRFLLGVLRKIADANGIASIPSVQEKLGEAASLAAVVEGMVLAAEAAAAVDANGVAVPERRFLYGVMGLQAEIYPRVLGIIRELSGAALIQLPSSSLDLTSPVSREDFERYGGTRDATVQERTQLFKLAWDIVGSEFAGRHLQYELFYAGAPFVARGYAYRYYPYDEAVALADSFLSSYGLDAALDAVTAAGGPGGTP